MEERQESKLVKEKPKKPGIFSRLKNRLIRYKRVLDVSMKPSKDEFKTSAKITGAGILFLGFIGFIIFLIYFLVVP